MLDVLLDPIVWAVILASAAYGIFVGSIPGLTATMAVALMVPLTLFMDDVAAIAAIVTTVTCSIFAGDIPATLIRIPGTPASAAYANDAYQLARGGRHVEALGVSLVFSVAGGLFGTLVLAVAAPQLARIATQFTSYEYFWLYVVGLTCAAVVSDQSRLRSAVAVLTGLLLSTVGLGTDFSAPRLTFGNDALITGISFIPAMIGLFGLSEVLRRALSDADDAPTASDGSNRTSHSLRLVWTKVVPLAWRRKWHLVRSSTIGALVGLLPGAGADMAAWISYAVSKQLSRTPEHYGRGTAEGMGDATGANNAALGGAWIPALVFGIPGDSVTAIAIGVLLMKNITPGPGIFDAENAPDQARLVASIYTTFVIANLLLIPLGLLAIRTSSLLMRVPPRTLMPFILMFCLIGAYAMNASYFDLWIMLAMGVLGFAFERLRIPLGPVVLGLLLGGELEHKFLQCLSKSTSVGAFFSSTISITLAACCLALWIAPFLMRRKAAD